MNLDILFLYWDVCYNKIYMDLFILAVILVVLKFAGILDIPLKWALAPIWITLILILTFLTLMSVYPEFILLLYSRVYS